MVYRVAVVGGEIDSEGRSVHGDLRLTDLSREGIAWETLQTLDADLHHVNTLYLVDGQRVDQRVLDRAPHVEHIARFGAGFDSIDVDACTASGVIVTTTPEAVRRPLALAGLTLILAVTHNLVQKHDIVRRGTWNQRGVWRGQHTSGSTISIIGFGGVGAELARMLVGLGLTVTGMNRRGAHPIAQELGIEMVSLEKALLADVVVLTAPLTSQTRGMIGEPELNMMQPGASLINIGRGGLVDQPALTRALGDSKIRAAGLDVFAQEPLPATDPLTRLPNVTLSPHSLCWTDEFAARAIEDINASIISVRERRDFTRVINPEGLRHPRWQAPAPCTQQ